MIGCSSRPLFRVDRWLKLASSCAKSNPPASFEGCCSYGSLSFSKRMSGPRHRLGSLTGDKKQKTVTCMWKPVSTQASSVEEHLVKDVPNNPEDGRQPEEGHGLEVIDIAEAASIETNLTTSCLEEKIQERLLEGNSLNLDEMHSLSVEVGSSLMRFIRGKGGSTQKEIEEEMNVKLLFPSSKKNDTIVIEGVSFDMVSKAAEKIQAIIDKAVKSRSLDYSHFVSLPLAIHLELVDKLVYFQNSILGKGEKSSDDNLESDSNEDNSDNEGMDRELREGGDGDAELKIEDDKAEPSSIPLVSYSPKSKPSALSESGIDKSIFIKPKTFHLTVLMLKLWNKERVNAAAEVLKSISVEVMDALEHRPVFIRLKGLDCMKGSLAKARVLYAPVKEIGSENRLLRACDVIKNAFIQAGLVLEEDAKQKLKLHATVMNARHRKGKGKKMRDSFDARGIFEQFGSKEWGEYLVREAHLSQRFVFDENGYYHCCASIPFPESMQED